MLDGSSSLTVGGVDDDSDEEFSLSVSGDVVSSLATDVRRNDGTATSRAAQLLNSAISSGEPYRAAKAFMAIEEPINRARAGDNGPVNEVMNSLYETTEITYQDVNTGEWKTENKSIIETENFAAAVSGGNFSKAEANNFSRDRVVMATGTGNGSVKEITVSSKDSSSAKSATKINGSSSADRETLEKANDVVNIAVTKSNSELFRSVVGGNRIVEGGSFLSNKINQRVLGAAPSDATTISVYHREVEEVIARKAEAERTKLSPFDISSPNTFFGSIVHTFAQALIRNSGSSGGNSTVPVMSAVADLASNSVNNLVNGATAEGEDVSYTTTAGSNCSTVNSAAGVEGDLYCTAHTTIETGYMYLTNADWGGKPDGYDEYIDNYMSREVTVGVNSADVCINNGSVITSIANFFGIGNVCSGVDTGIATGSKYTLSGSNTNSESVGKITGYILHDKVYSLLSEKQSETSRALEEYYAEHLVDDSAAGRLARISGMTKAEAEIALNYASYLDFIAKYDASEKYAFGEIKIEVKKSFFTEQDEKVKETLYGVWSKRAEYRDERNRNFTV